MITTAIINLAYGIAGGFLSLFDNLDLDFLTDLDNSIENVNGLLSSFNFLIPVSSLIAVIGIYLIIEVGFLSFKIFNWIIKKIPFIS